MIGAMATSFRRFLADEGGNATMEFVLTFPMIIVIFCAGFESSFYICDLATWGRFRTTSSSPRFAAAPLFLAA
jgi:hypothetical protein